MARYVYVFGWLRDDGFELVDAAGKQHRVSGYLACVDGRVALRARWREDRDGLTRVRFSCGRECWVRLERPDLQLDAA